MINACVVHILSHPKPRRSLIGLSQMDEMVLMFFFLNFKTWYVY